MPKFVKVRYKNGPAHEFWISVDAAKRPKYVVIDGVERDTPGRVEYKSPAPKPAFAESESGREAYISGRPSKKKSLGESTEEGEG